MRLNPFYRCKNCRKVHVVTHIGSKTVCKCGANLWWQMFRPLTKD